MCGCGSYFGIYYLQLILHMYCDFWVVLLVDTCLSYRAEPHLAFNPPETCMVILFCWARKKTLFMLSSRFGIVFASENYALHMAIGIVFSSENNALHMAKCLLIQIPPGTYGRSSTSLVHVIFAHLCLCHVDVFAGYIVSLCQLVLLYKW